MVDPVIDNEGISYERTAIEEWIRRGNSNSPATKKRLLLSDLKPNRALKNLIQHWKENEEEQHIEPKNKKLKLKR